MFYFYKHHYHGRTTEFLTTSYFKEIFYESKEFNYLTKKETIEKIYFNKNNFEQLYPDFIRVIDWKDKRAVSQHFTLKEFLIYMGEFKIIDLIKE